MQATAILLYLYSLYLKVICSGPSAYYVYPNPNLPYPNPKSHAQTIRSPDYRGFLLKRSGTQANDHYGILFDVPGHNGQ